jgi:putative redox protein
MNKEGNERMVESASVALAEGMHFVGDIDGYRIDLDAEESVGGRGAGTQPLRLLLLGMAGCTAMDVVSILRKKRQQVSGLEVEVQGGRVDEHPRVYDRIEIIYRVRDRGMESKAVERAIELSETRYCPAIAMLEKAAEITSRYEVEEVK